MPLTKFCNTLVSFQWGFWQQLSQFYITLTNFLFHVFVIFYWNIVSIFLYLLCYLLKLLEILLRPLYISCIHNISSFFRPQLYVTIILRLQFTLGPKTLGKTKNSKHFSWIMHWHGMHYYYGIKHVRLMVSYRGCLSTIKLLCNVNHM